MEKRKPLKSERAPKHKTSKPRHKILEAQLEAICKLIVFWRDASQCVERHIDGGRCGGGIQWGHYIPRNQSNRLKYELGNTHAQCRDHNMLHLRGAQTMGVWFASYFGVDVAQAMEAEREAHRGEKNYTVQELEALLAHYENLYQNRFYVDLELDALITNGYYGSVIARIK